MTNSERTRRYARHRVRVPVKVFTRTGESLTGLSNDVSERGMALYLCRKFEIGEVIALEFRFPSSKEKIKIAALVRDCEGFRCGVEFQELYTTDAMLINTCCDRLSEVLYAKRASASITV